MALVCDTLRTLASLIFIARTSAETVSEVCEDAIPANLTQSIITRYEMCCHLKFCLVIVLVPILAIDLLERLLKFDPAERISAAEALSHPYFTSAVTPTPFGLNTSPGSMPPPSFNFPHPHGHQAQQQFHQQQQRSQNPPHGHAPQYARPVYNQHMPPPSMAYPPDPTTMGQPQYTGVQFAAAPPYNHAGR